MTNEKKIICNHEYHVIICIIKHNVNENTRSIVKENTISNIRIIEYNVDKIRDLA